MIDLGIENSLKIQDSLSTGGFYTTKALFWAFSKSTDYSPDQVNLLKKSLTYYSQGTSGKAHTLFRLAESYYSVDSVAIANEYFRQLNEIKDSINPNMLSSLFIIKLTAENEFERVDSLLLDKLQREISQNIEGGVAYSYALLAQNSMNLGFYKQAIERGLTGYEYAVKKGLTKERSDILTILIKVYEQEGDYKNAFLRSKEFDSIKDSFVDITEQLAQKDLQKNEAEEIAENEKLLNDKKTLELQNKQNQQYILFGGIGVFVLLTFFAFRAYRQKRKDHILIENQKKLVEAQRDEVELQKTIIEEAHREITDSINYAERIQRSFLATDDLLSSNLKDYFVFFQPKDVVSGDFYWAKKLKNNEFAILNADSTGHGVPGAIMSILNVSSIEWSVEKGMLEPAAIFNNARELIIDRLKKDGSEQGGKDGMDASLISIDFEHNKMNFVAANNPIWIVRDNQLIEIKGEKMPVGKHEKDHEPFIGGSYNLQTNDLIYTITDGFQDQFGGEKGKKFKMQPLKDLLIAHSHLPLAEQKTILSTTFNSWKANLEQIDDVCVIVVRI
jgi:serine phosphatase RsbU (regulator of sigma subunit)